MPVRARRFLVPAALLAALLAGLGIPPAARAQEITMGTDAVHGPLAGGPATSVDRDDDIGIIEPWTTPSHPPVLELTADLGLLDRGTTGVGAPLLGLGYDHGGGLLAGAGARLLFRINEFFRHGPSLRVAYQAGRFFGLGGYGFGWTSIDAAYTFRTKLPCMSTEDRQWFLAGRIGVAAVLANAGTGTAPRDDRWNERVAASNALDHFALGPMIGVDAAVHLHHLILGVDLSVREPFAFGSGPISRSFVTQAAFRAGVQIDP